MSLPKNQPDETISTEFISNVCQRLSQDKSVIQNLPGEGRLHIDRPLPFLCIYRHPVKHEDTNTSRLIVGEASYLIAPGDKNFKPGLTALVENLVETLVEKFESVLVIEIWAAPLSKNNNSEPTVSPAFDIITSKNRPPTATIEALEKSLSRIKILKRPAKVEVIYNKKRSPAGLPMLIPSNTAHRLNCFVIGLEIAPVYLNPATGQVFPVMLRNLQRDVSRALRRAFFEFSRAQTSYRAPSYQALGRRAVVKAVWDIDKKLADISNRFDFLLQVTPVNIDQAWAEFKKKRFERAPTLYYRPLPVDPANLKGKLYQIPTERVEDPTLAFLFRQKRTEIDRQLTMLADRGTRQFLYGSLQLFGAVDDSLKELADELLRKISPRSREGVKGKTLNAKDFARRAVAEIEYFRQSYPTISATVQIRDDTVGLMVSQGNLLIGKGVKISNTRVDALLQHEVGTHILTYFNGKAQPFQQLYTGLAGYEELQEGLAVLAEYLAGGLSKPRLRLLAGRVIAARCLVDGASFVDTFRLLTKSYGFKQYTAFVITVRIYRGGGLTKDAVYLRGLAGVLKYISRGGTLEPLYVGKIATTHIPIIQELQLRQVLRPVPLYPRYLHSPETAAKLQRLQQGVSILDLVKRSRA